MITATITPCQTYATELQKPMAKTKCAMGKWRAGKNTAWLGYVQKIFLRSALLKTIAVISGRSIELHLHIFGLYNRVELGGTYEDGSLGFGILAAVHGYDSVLLRLSVVVGVRWLRVML